MNDALRDPLVIEVEDFLTKDKIFEERGTSFTRAQGVLIVGDPVAEVISQVAKTIMAITVMCDVLVELATVADVAVHLRLARTRSVRGETMVIDGRGFVLGVAGHFISSIPHRSRGVPDQAVRACWNNSHSVAQFPSAGALRAAAAARSSRGRNRKLEDSATPLSLRGNPALPEIGIPEKPGERD